MGINPSENELDEILEADPIYQPIYHNSSTFNPRRIADLIPQNEIDRCHPERQQFEKLQLMLANHLQLMHAKGRFRWPRKRSQIESKFNTLPRVHFPDSGDIEDE